MVNIVKYFKEVREELVKVTWPSREQTLNKTALVIIASVVVGVYIGALDFVFTLLAQTILK
jgi:preprotein translocase subunit SecE